MNLAAFLFSTVTVLMHSYMEKDRGSDLSKTLDEIKDDINFPRPEQFDFIIGKSHTLFYFVHMIPRGEIIVFLIV